MQVYELYDGEQWWYIGDSEDEVLRMHLKPIIGDLPDDLTLAEEQIEYAMGCSLDEIEVVELDPSEEIEIRLDDSTDEITVKTAEEWIKVNGGCGFLACTVW